MEWITAIGTVAIAVTAWLAFCANRKLVDSNQGLVDVARKQADLAQMTLLRQIEPRLVPGDPERYRTHDKIVTQVGPQTFETRRLYIEIENAGSGLAMITQAQAASSERGSYVVWPPPAIPPGEGRPLKLTPGGGVPHEPPPGETIQVRVEYSGLDGVARTLRFDAQHYPGEDWLVTVKAPDG